MTEILIICAQNCAALAFVIALSAVTVRIMKKDKSKDNTEPKNEQNKKPADKPKAFRLLQRAEVFCTCCGTRSADGDFCRVCGARSFEKI